MPYNESRDEAIAYIESAGLPPIHYVKTSNDGVDIGFNRLGIPEEYAKRKMEIRFPAGPGTLEDLVYALDLEKIPIVFRWENPDAEELLERRIPFTRFSGTVEELMNTLSAGLGIAFWGEYGRIYISDMDRFAVALPQNEDVLSAVQSELELLGAHDIVSSLRGGTILYSTSPQNQREQIAPYLERMVKNLSMITMQVAVVSISITDNSAAGFDWAALSGKLDTRASSISKLKSGVSSSTGSSSSDGDSDSDSDTDSDSSTESELGTIIDVTAKGLSFGRTSLGSVFGAYGAIDVAGAIAFLSEFGQTKVTQNVELRTLSGSEVKLRSGQEVPYVSGIGSTSTGENTSSNVETSTVQTGITLGVVPHFDWQTSTVTVDVDLELKAVLDFIEVNAGNDVGSFTQPLTQDQSLTDIVRVVAGQTVVIGGLQYDSVSGDANEPSFLRKSGSLESTFGKNSREVSRTALFIIIRPTVTIYGDAPSSEIAKDAEQAKMVSAEPEVTP
ncbi:type II secretion system protein GspD [Thalassospira xiamenensis]|nr:type II and III secretion system protein [Thalassospira xiamenensis]